jgi:hypothetical protein
MLPLFESSTHCPLTPSAYLRRILDYTNTSPCNVLVGLVYLQRLKDQANARGCIRLALTTFNIQRLLLTATMLASKVHDDHCAPNKQWALVGDIHLREFNELELDMLFCLQFSLTVTREEYDHRRKELEQLVPVQTAACEPSASWYRDACRNATACTEDADPSDSPCSVSSDTAHSSEATHSPCSVSSDTAHSSEATHCDEMRTTSPWVSRAQVCGPLTD